MIATEMDSTTIFLIMIFGLLHESICQIGRFPFGEEYGDSKLPSGDDSSFEISFSILFAGVTYNTVFINTNGIISLNSEYTAFNQEDFPIIPDPLIAPFWRDLITTISGSIFFRFVSDTGAIDSAINAYNNFPSPAYVSSRSLLITWDQVPLYGGSQGNVTFQVYLTTNEIRSYVFYVYHDDTYPSGAVVGINVGNGIDFVLLASTTAGNSDTIARGTNAEFFGSRGLYFYRVDSLLALTLTRTCVDYEIRLAGTNSSTHQGRVEVCYNNTWSTVCDDFWDTNDANVVCKLLGFSATGNMAVGGAAFGQGTGRILLDNLQCNGTESSLLECAHSGLNRHNCSHLQDAGVICSNRHCADGDIRLAGTNSSTHQGRVELCYKNAWGTVCDDLWDTEDANVVCKQLGFSYTGNVATGGATFGQGTRLILLDNVQCNGTESSLLECVHNGIYGHNCGHHKDAGVMCEKKTSRVIPSKVYSNCSSDIPGWQEEVLQILSSNYGVSLLGLSRQHPALSCSEIYDANPTANDGLYWIGSGTNIRQQHCNF